MHAGPDGFFYDTHHRLWDTCATMVVSSEDVPRAPGHIADIVQLYGKSSNKYRVRVLGEFPTHAEKLIAELTVASK